MKKWKKCKITEFFVKENIAVFSKFPVALTINALCYWIKYFGKKTIFIFIFPFFDLQIFFTNWMIAFFQLYTDFQLSWPILKVELKSRTFQNQHALRSIFFRKSHKVSASIF